MNSEISSRELNWLIINSVLAAAGVAAFVLTAGRRLLVPAVPESALFAVGMFAILMLIYPVASIGLRQKRGRGLSWVRHALGSVLGAIVAGLIHMLLS